MRAAYRRLLCGVVLMGSVFVLSLVAEATGQTECVDALVALAWGSGALWAVAGVSEVCS